MSYGTRNNSSSNYPYSNIYFNMMIMVQIAILQTEQLITSFPISSKLPF